MRKSNVRLALMILVACAARCGSGQSLRVTSIQLGRSVNADSTVSSFTTSFAPTETVYLSVATDGAGTGTLSVRWVFVGRVIDEPKKHVSYRIPAATEFRLQSATGFPPGDYTAEVFLDGQSAGVRAFKVEIPR